MMARLVRLEVALLTLAAVLAVGIAVALVQLNPAPRLTPVTVPAAATAAPTTLPATPAGVVAVAAPWTWPTWLPLAGLLAGALLLAPLGWRARLPLRRVAQRLAARGATHRAVARARPAPPRSARRRRFVRMTFRQWTQRVKAGLQRMGTGVQRLAQRLATQLAAVQVPSLPGRRPQDPGADRAVLPHPRDVAVMPGTGRGSRRAEVLAEALAALPAETLAGMCALDPRAEREELMTAQPVVLPVFEEAPVVELPAAPLTLPPALDHPQAAPPLAEEELPLTALSSVAPAPLPDLRAVVVPSAPPAVSALDRAQQAAVLLATGWATHGMTQPVLRLSADPKDGTVLVHLAPGAADDSALAGWLSTVGGSWRDATTLRLPVADVALGMQQPPVLLPIAAERGATHFWPLATYGALGIYGAEAIPLALALLASALFQASPDTLALHLVDPGNRLRPALADVPHTLAGLDDATVLSRLPAALWQPLPADGRLLLVVLVAPDAATLAALAPVYRRLRRRGAAGLALVLVCPTLEAAGRELYPVLPALITGVGSGEAAWLPGHTWAAAGRVRGWSPQQDWTAPLPSLDEGGAQQLLAGVRGAPRSTVPTVLDASGWGTEPAAELAPPPSPVVIPDSPGPIPVPALVAAADDVDAAEDGPLATADGEVAGVSCTPPAEADPLPVGMATDDTVAPVTAPPPAAPDRPAAAVVPPTPASAGPGVPARVLPDPDAPLEAPAVTFDELDADGQATVLAMLGAARLPATPPETIPADDAVPADDPPDAPAAATAAEIAPLATPAPDATPTWPAGAGLDPAALAELVAAALAASPGEIVRKVINTLLEQRGVIVNQGVIAKELLPWLARAGVLEEVPRAPYRWLMTDLAAIAAALAAHPYEET